MFSSFAALLVFCRLAFAEESAAGQFQPWALQTGPDTLGSSFAASAYVHPSDQSIWIIGSTFGTAFSPHSPVSSQDDFQGGCFLASLDPTSSEGLEWKQRQTLARSGVQQACTNMLFQSNRIIATGYAQQGNELDEQYQPGGYNEVAQFGMVLDLAVDVNKNGTLALQGGHLMQESTITYPIAVHAQAGDNYAYILSMETNEDTYNQPGKAVNQQDPARYFLYGSNQYGMVVTQIFLSGTTSVSNPSLSAENNSEGELTVLGEGWRKPFATNTGDSVHASGILKISDDVLLAVGTTSGHGTAFGKDALSGGDLDGFITKLNPNNGQLVGGWDDPSNLASVRVQSINQRDDWVSGLCHNPRDSNYFYVVGATKGRMKADAQESLNPSSVQAFIMKVNVFTLTPSWITQLAAPDSESKASWVRAASCAVTPDGGSVYFGGIVEKGSVLSLSGTKESFGGDDVFVAKVEASTGALKFVRQFGSEGDDEIAMRGGLATDAQGNAIVVGNTYGSIYRRRRQEESATKRSDVFIASIGAFSGKLVIPVRPSDPEADDAGQDGPEVDEVVEPKWSGILFIFFGVLSAGLCVCCIVRRKREREVATDRKHVLGYLGDFDVEDVDLKHSATGGWHCSYAGPLAHGINNKSRFRNSFTDYAERDEDITSPLTEAAVYTDSLFMDASEKPRLRSAANLGEGGLSITESLSRKQDGSRTGWGREII